MTPVGASIMTRRGWASAVFTLFALTLGHRAAGEATGKFGPGWKEALYGISCCSDGFSTGDNVNGDKERFIQANQYEIGCQESCKKHHPSSIGMTVSLNQQYRSGNGVGRSKCWCELEFGNLNPTNRNYRTCLFHIPDALPIAVNAAENYGYIDYGELFSMADKDSDGQLTAPEYIEVLLYFDDSFSTNYPKLGEKAWISVLMADTNGDNKLNFDEFINQWLVQLQRSQQDSNAHIEKGEFNLFDTNSDGQLSRSEFAQLFNSMLDGEVLGSRVISAIIYKMDKNKDEMISLKEYLDAWASA